MWHRSGRAIRGERSQATGKARRSPAPRIRSDPGRGRTAARACPRRSSPRPRRHIERGPRGSDQGLDIDIAERAGQARTLERIDPDLPDNARLGEPARDVFDLLLGEAPWLADRVGEP